ncbi:MAG: hypothetical protein M1536_00225 [Firmicutes bacterium]|nr:hypothetical protein [Bacillota bacterium]
MTRGISHKRKGFLSILELVFALFIFLAGFLMILGVYPTSFMSVGKSREFIFATNIAQREMERLKAIPYNNFPAALAGTSVNLYSSVDTMQFVINGKTIPVDFDWTDKVSTYMQDDPNFNYKGLQVTVGWQSSSTGYHVYTLETLIVNQN